jgi:outer membrane protein OmpA-like peptidoglycan-associated protein
MKSLINILLLLFALNGFSQTKVKSFYFLLNYKVPTPYSQEQLKKLNSSVKSGSIKIIEINSFTDSIGTASFNDTLAQIRLANIAQGLQLSPDVKLNAYALQRPYTIENALNWRRVDVIYMMSRDVQPELTADINNEIELIEDTNHQKEDLSHLNDDPEVIPTIQDDVFSKSFHEMKPLVLDISFKEGTSKILESSYREITKLVIYLKENPTIKAEIRGHVCCGNNMRISQSRAKSVYRRLIKQGISKDRLSFKGMSNNEPLVFPETTNADRQKNRRVDVVLHKD